MRYIGGKSLLLENINNVITTEIPDVSSVIDLFSGSGAVSTNFKSKGYRTISNDILYFCYVLSRASIVINKMPSFRALGVGDPIKYLNELSIESTDFKIDDCFIFNNYSPNQKCERVYRHVVSRDTPEEMHFV